MVETTKFSLRNSDWGGKGNIGWKLEKLKMIDFDLRNYDAQEEAKWRNRPRLTDANIDILVKVHRAEMGFLEKLVDKKFLGY